ncbi:MAG: UDP-glucose 4-epimerase GalE [Bacteroidia bacterium]|nr:UDP-glucose 4-epimerase GalE [Bacteroidia bacterium]
MPTILITGGCGYIGSHTAVELLERGQAEVISIDNLCNSSEQTLDRIEAITGKRMRNYAVDLCDLEATREVFRQHPDIEGVIHFAALKSVGESVEQPLRYFHNNTESLLNILACCKEFGVKGLIFSSSCSLYGNISSLPVTEETPLSEPESPYAYTKLLGERILKDFTRAHAGTQVIALRYFNPVGAHHTGLIGEDPINKPSNLVPVITQTASGLIPKMSVFGGDYPTRDGSCVRDYVHVTDIALAHLTALEYLREGRQEALYDVYNLGSGQGVTVLEAIGAFERNTGVQLRYEVGPRRPGDVVAIYSDCSKALRQLGWTAERGIDEMMRSAWKWQQHVNAERQVQA